MRLVNGPAGYGTVTKVLHWLTVAALAIQFTVGYAMEAVSEWVSGTDDSHADEAAVFVHGWIGGGILALATIRLVWRLRTPLPPWAPQLTAAEKRLATVTERTLYTLLFVIPATGIGLLYLSGKRRDIAEDQRWEPPYDLIGDDALLAAHITAHVVFYVTLAVHVGLALRRRTLSRML